ncbi:MAG TPA: hypothetical protein VKR58_01665, partial [Aquella sp.]|nr:hypothetical protein [Aquella sp.]
IYKIKKLGTNPVNIINGIILPAVNDPRWRSHEVLHLYLDNFVVQYDNGTNMTDAEIVIYDDFSTRNHDESKGHYVIAHGEDAIEYVKQVRWHHMKYLAEMPEIKQLDSIEPESRQLELVK